MCAATAATSFSMCLLSDERCESEDHTVLHTFDDDVYTQNLRIQIHAIYDDVKATERFCHGKLYCVRISICICECHNGAHDAQNRLL